MPHSGSLEGIRRLQKDGFMSILTLSDIGQGRKHIVRDTAVSVREVSQTVIDAKKNNEDKT